MEENWDVHSPLNVVGRRLQIRAQAIPCDHPGTHLCLGAWFQQELLLDANKHYVCSKKKVLASAQDMVLQELLLELLLLLNKKKLSFL